MVFDMSFSRQVKSREEQTTDKLTWLKRRDVYGFAYFSHVSVVIASADKDLLGVARQTLRKDAKLPDTRFLTA